MADEAQEVVIKIEPDPDNNVAAAVSTTPATDKQVDAVADLKQQFTAMQARAEGAEQRAVRAEQTATKLSQEVVQAKTTAVDSQLETVEQGISAAEIELDAAEASFKSAMEAGDFDKAAKAQRAMALAGGNIARLREAVDDMKARKEQVSKEKPAPVQPDDPFEAFVATKTAPTAAWLRQHRDWVTDPTRNARLTAAHFNAVAEKLVPDTQEYFDHVEQFLGLKQKTETLRQPPPPPSANEQRAPVAPVNGHASSGGTQGGPAEVRLSQSEARSATDGTLVWNYDDPSGQKRFKKGDPIGIQEFARRKLEQMRSGQHDRVFVSQ